MTTHTEITSKLEPGKPQSQSVAAAWSLISLMASRRRGTTLIEMMMVIVIMSILGLGMVYLMTALFNSSIEGNQRYLQQAEIGTASDYFASKTVGVKTDGVGLYNPDGSVVPVSFAGDQMVFQTNGTCYRIMYFEWLEEVRVAQSELGCGPIAPVRGPNEVVAGSGHVQSNPKAANRDPVLDDLQAKSWVLISKASKDIGTADPSYSSLYPVFKFFRSDGASYLVDDQANSGSVNSFYADGTKAKHTDHIGVYLSVAPPVASSSSIVPPQKFQTTFYLDN